MDKIETLSSVSVGSNEIIKKRRGRPKKIHQQQKQAEREAKEREHQQQQQALHQQQLAHMNDGYMSNCFSPAMMSPPKPFTHMAPYPQMSEPQSYYGDPYGKQHYDDVGEPSPEYDQQSSQQQQQQQQYSHPAEQHNSPAGTPNYGGYMAYHEQEQHVPTPMSQTTDEHSHHSHPTPPHNHPHTPTHSMSPHPHEQYGKGLLRKFILDTADIL